MLIGPDSSGSRGAEGSEWTEGLAVRMKGKHRAVEPHGDLDSLRGCCGAAAKKNGREREQKRERKKKGTLDRGSAQMETRWRRREQMMRQTDRGRI